MSTVSDSKQSTMIGCLRTRVRKQPIIALHFESENELKVITSGPGTVTGARTRKAGQQTSTTHPCTID